MKLARISLILCLVLGLLITFTSIPASNNKPQTINQHQKTNSSRILVKFRDGIEIKLAQQAHERIHKRYGCRQVDQIQGLEVSIIEVPDGMLSNVLKSYRNEPGVEYAEPDPIVDTLGSANDPCFSKQWYLSKVKAPVTWGKNQGSPAVKIAILDSGIDLDHPDLQNRIVSSKNFSSSKTLDDKFGHGTHIAGIAAAITNNKIGIAGSSYGCSLMNVKVLDDLGTGYTDWIAKGIVWAADNGAKVINLSFGTPYPSSALEDAIEYAWSKGALIVAASGNDGGQSLNYPAAYSTCIAVAATDKNDNKAAFSPHGSWIDVAAPGVAILSTLPNHKYSMFDGFSQNYGHISGTSMSSALVAGLAGLIWSSKNNASNEAVRNRIENFADRPTTGDIYKVYGIPRISFYRSMIE